MTIHSVTRSLPTNQLRRMADGPQYPAHARLKALMVLGERLRIATRPTPTAEDVLKEVMADERFPIELRTRAAMALLEPSVGEVDISRGD